MRNLYIVFAVSFVAIATSLIASAPAAETISPPSTGVRDFDFLIGEWRVHHRRPKPGTGEWVDFEGTLELRTLMDGSANLEEHAINSPNGAYRAVGLRAYDAKSGQWAIWWLDSRYPSRPLDPPVVGRFENGIGKFYADYMQDGKPMRGRFIWSDITPASARWEQAGSADGGKTWEPNWIMNLQRDTTKTRGTPAATDPAAVRDFDFLIGDWRVHHRYLRVKDNTREWVDVEGTVSHRSLMGGLANMEEHTINTPGGVNRAVALRSYDPKASHWSIWWLDGRAPHGKLDPPVQGRFENGVGTFYGDITIDDKPTRVRFIWSQITASSARWEQAYSSDAGKTWETNWIMEFRRTS